MDHSPEQAANLLRHFADKTIKKATVNAFRRGVTGWRKSALELFRSRGIGRSIFGKKAKGASKLVSRTRARVIGDTITAGLTAKGLAGLQEAGGRTRPHTIKAKNGKLVFQGRRGLVVTSQVRHPGGSIAVHPFLRPSAERALPDIARDINKAYEEAIARELR